MASTFYVLHISSQISMCKWAFFKFKIVFDPECLSKKSI